MERQIESTAKATCIVLINADAGGTNSVWAVGETLAAAKDEVARIAGMHVNWEEVNLDQFRSIGGWSTGRYIAVEAPAGEWEAGDAERVFSVGEVVGLFLGTEDSWSHRVA